MPTPRTISLCYAVYQNAGSLEELYQRSREVMEQNFPELEWEIVFVNDGSTDGSLEKLPPQESFARQGKPFHQCSAGSWWRQRVFFPRGCR